MSLRKIAKMDEEESNSGSEDSSPDMAEMKEKVDQQKELHRLDMSLQLMLTLFASLKKKMSRVWDVRSNLLQSFGIKTDEPEEDDESEAEDEPEPSNQVTTWGEEEKDPEEEDGSEKEEDAPIMTGGGDDAWYWAGEMKVGLELLETVQDKFGSIFSDADESINELIKTLKPE
jgi:hypothetical protein